MANAENLKLPKKFRFLVPGGEILVPWKKIIVDGKEKFHMRIPEYSIDCYRDDIGLLLSKVQHLIDQRTEIVWEEKLFVYFAVTEQDNAGGSSTRQSLGHKRFRTGLLDGEIVHQWHVVNCKGVDGRPRYDVWGLTLAGLPSPLDGMIVDATDASMSAYVTLSAKIRSYCGKLENEIRKAMRKFETKTPPRPPQRRRVTA